MSESFVPSAVSDRSCEVLEALRRLDRRLAQAVAVADQVFGPGAADDRFRGMHISPAEVDRLLQREPGTPSFAPGSATEPRVEAEPWTTLQQTYGLSDFDLDLMLIALAPDVDLRYERLYAYLQDDVVRRRPTVDLALDLLCSTTAEKLARRAHVAANAPLVRHQLVHLVADVGHAAPPLLAHSLELDEQVTRFVLGQRALDTRFAAWCELVPVDESFDGLALEPVLYGEMLAPADESHDAPVRVYFGGPTGIEKRSAVRALSALRQLPLLSADLARMPAETLALPRVFELLCREAWFLDALLYLENVDALAPAHLESLLHAVTASPASIVLAARWPEPHAARAPSGLRCVTYSRTDASLPASGSLGAWFAAARSQSGEALTTLTHKIRPRYSWADIVLPDDSLAQLRELASRFTHSHKVLDEWGFGQKLARGTAVNALFSGPSGTGKTMAAEIIAGDLGLDLYRINLAAVVSKYIGDTEKNLDRIFEAAEDTTAILFFDEADALFGKRSEVRDSHDRYANVELSYLLQRFDEYTGVAILATNLRQNMDEAFNRRLAFHVYFPFPDAESRRRIWAGLWPSATPLNEDVDLELLARRFKLSGGNIKNVVLAAAFMAAEEGASVGMAHLMHAVRREYQKLGKPLDAAELEVVREREPA